MGQETDRIKQSSNQRNWQTPSSTSVGADLDFANIMNTIGQGLLVTGEGWRFEFINPAFARLIGRPIEDLIGKSMDEFVVPEDLPLLLKHRSDRLAGKTTSYEVRLKKPDGKIVWVHATGVPRLIEDRVIGSISVVDDLTVQKDIEAALKAERDRAEIYLNIAEVILLALDTEARITLLNRKGYQIIGYEEGQLIGKDWIETCLRPQDHESVHEVNRKIIRGEIDPFEYYENYVLTKDGQERRIAWHTTLLKDANNKIIGTLSSGEDITDRKRAEEALKESENKYRQLANVLQENLGFIQHLIDAIPNPIFYKDVNGIYKGCNSAFEKYLGLSKKEIIGKSVYDISPRDLAERYHNMDQKLFDNPGTQVYESSVLYFDGTRHDVVFNKATYADANGNLLGLVGVILDITERKRTEDALRESDQFNREIISNAKEGIIVYDRAFRYKVWNRYMEDLTGISASQAIGKTAFELFPHLLDQGIDRLLESALDGEIVTSVDIPYYVPNSGKSGWFVGTYGPNRDANGFIIGVIGIIHDITDRKQADNALRESEEKYRQLAENVTDVIWTMGMDLKFTYISPSNERITGFTREESMALTLEKILTSSSLETAMRVLAEELDKEKLSQKDISRSRTFEAEEICKDGHTIWVEIKTAFLRNHEGEPIGIQGISRDISERKRMEEELIRSHCELEQRVKERTEELARKNAEMERFIYTVSHDLRTPLISVGGFLGLIKQDVEEGDLKRLDVDLRIAGEAITKMDRLLQDTLELSRIGRIINPPDDVPFYEIIEDALSQTTEKLKSKKVKVTVPTDLPKVHVDRMRIAEVLVNLIENSIKYMGSQDRPEIEIGQRIEGNKNIFFVRDNGIGIDPSQNDKVFELFYKIDNKSEGTGVGLAIVKRIIEVHGGHIWIESELGKGCTVFFTLPQAANSMSAIDDQSGPFSQD